MTLVLAEQEMEKISLRTQDVFSTTTDPIKPHVKKAINVLDAGLEKIEPIRKNITPKGIKKHNKETYTHLVNHHYNKKLMKYYMKKSDKSNNKKGVIKSVKKKVKK
jgi:hypothetical protein